MYVIEADAKASREENIPSIYRVKNTTGTTTSLEDAAKYATYSRAHKFAEEGYLVVKVRQDPHWGWTLDYS
tara:strand:- start:681 stop:893 length:213 start_codon:yes stop_codon:yes gene_type:complete